jgi:hypothetical protein
VLPSGLHLRNQPTEAQGDGDMGKAMREEGE